MHRAPLRRHNSPVNWSIGQCAKLQAHVGKRRDCLEKLKSQSKSRTESRLDCVRQHGRGNWSFRTPNFPENEFGQNCPQNLKEQYRKTYGSLSDDCISSFPAAQAS